MPVNTYHALVLGGSGNYYFTCGSNTYGQLGTGDNENKAIFTQVNLPERFVALSAGSFHSLAISESDGSLWSWGSNSHGQLGQPREISVLTKPTKIPNTHSFIQISGGDYFSMALDSTGHVWSFGQYAGGCLGLGHIEANQFTPQRIEGLPEIKSISAGYWHGIVLDLNGEIWLFGCNNAGQLGLGDTDNRWTPCKIEGIPQIVQISAGFYHNLILDHLGHVWSFGENADGLECLNDFCRPEKIPGMENIVQVFAGDSSILVNEEQQVFVFGRNEDFQLNMENQDVVRSPVEQPLWRGKTIIPGGSQTIVLDEEGYLFFFGTHHDFIHQGKHEGVRIEQRKMISTKNARSIGSNILSQ